MLLLMSLQYPSLIHPVLHPPVVVACVVVVVFVVQSPPSELHSALFDSWLQTPFATNSVWEQSL